MSHESWGCGLVAGAFFIGGVCGGAVGWYFTKPTAEQTQLLERASKPDAFLTDAQSLILERASKPGAFVTEEERQIINRAGKPLLDTVRTFKDEGGEYLSIQINKEHYFFAKTAGTDSYEPLQNVLDKKIEEIKEKNNALEEKLKAK